MSKDSGFTRPRLVFLGASNLQRGLGHVTALAQTQHDGPIDFEFVHGDGRSFGLEAGAFGQRLPSILESSLWSRLAVRAGTPCAAWIMDVGNDLAYGVPVATIEAWVVECFDRLRSHGARITFVRPPVERIERLSPVWFWVARSVLFPGRRMQHAEIVASARDLDGRLTAHARSRGARVVTPALEWYGVDPIHVLSARRLEAFATILGVELEGAVEPRLFQRQRQQLRLLCPEHRRWFGRSRSTPQPSVHLEDGSTVAWL